MAQISLAASFPSSKLEARIDSRKETAYHQGPSRHPEAFDGTALPLHCHSTQRVAVPQLCAHD